MHPNHVCCICWHLEPAETGAELPHPTSIDEDVQVRLAKADCLMLRVAMVMKISCVGNGWDAVMWERADTHKMPGLYKL